jgi:hypothetical protein
VLSFLYWALRRLLELLVLRMRSERVKEIEILVLRHQLQVLKRQVARPQLRPADRAPLAAFSWAPPRRAWSSSLVTPAAVNEMGWEEMQALFAATYVDEIAAARRGGGKAVVRSKLAALSDEERRSLRVALDELRVV